MVLGRISIEQYDITVSTINSQAILMFPFTD